jgi:hypothetical protein
MKPVIKRFLRRLATVQPLKGLLVNLVYPGILAALRNEIQPDVPSTSGIAEAFAWKTHSHIVLNEELRSGIDCGGYNQGTQVRLFDVVAQELGDIEGDVLEFGVAAGHSLRHLASLFKGRKIYGFDSFQGIPEPWWTRPSGAFAVDSPPRVDAPNVELVEGIFSETVPEFLKRWQGTAGLVHVDCDLYTSTMESLGAVVGRCRTGTVILFDEYYNYPDFAQHEWRAWRELRVCHGIVAPCIAYDGRRAAFQIRQRQDTRLA